MAKPIFSGRSVVGLFRESTSFRTPCMDPGLALTPVPAAVCRAGGTAGSLCVWPPVGPGRLVWFTPGFPFPESFQGGWVLGTFSRFDSFLQPILRDEAAASGRSASRSHWQMGARGLCRCHFALGPPTSAGAHISPKNTPK